MLRAPQASKRYAPIDWFNDPSGGPRWRHIKPFLESIREDRRQEALDQLTMKYPTWFFEALTEVVIEEKLQLEEFQIAYLLDNSDFKITNKTRQAGGSLVVSMDKFWRAYTREGYECNIVSITRSEAQGKIRYIRNLWESLPLRWRIPLSVDNTEQIGFHSGRRKSFIKSTAPTPGLRGGKKDIVFDEAAHIALFAHLFTAALPATIRDGAFDIISTPLGKSGKFYEIWSDPKGDYEDFSRHAFMWWNVSFFCTDPHEAQRVWIEEYGENPFHLYQLLEDFGTERIKKIVRPLTDEEYTQEFCGVFVDETEAFFPYDLIETCRWHHEESIAGRPVLEKWTQRPADNENEVYIGVDFAQGKKGGDSTSVQVVERTDSGIYTQRYFEDMNHQSGFTNFDKQIDRINDIIDRFRPTRVRVDMTSLGIPLTEALKNTWGNLIEGVTFNNHNKEDMALTIKNLMEREQLGLQYENERIRGQIHGIKRKILPSGSIGYSGHPHDDMFWALALACKTASYKRVRIIDVDGEYL